MNSVIVVVVIVLAFPFMLYTSVKLGTYAFFRGRQLYQEENHDGKKSQE